jgi:beta-lactamase class D
MMRNWFIGGWVVALFCHPAVAETSVQEVAALGKFFREQKVVGTFVMLDPEADTLHVWSEARAKQRYIPASTFKIPHALIGLHVGAVANVEEVLPYGGEPQRLKQWEKDMNLRDAIVVSNVPVYREMARRVGLERMREAVKAIGYGNAEIGAVVDRFWLDGPLEISAIEQVQFLQRLTSGQLPMEEKAVQAVMEITPLEKGEKHALRGKTGWYWPDGGGQQIGWWVGWVERHGKTYPFALNIDIHSDEDAAKRIPIARACLAALGKL